MREAWVSDKVKFKTSMQIIHNIFCVNFYFLVKYNTYCKILNTLITICFEANLSQALIETLLINKMLIQIK